MRCVCSDCGCEQDEMDRCRSCNGRRVILQSVAAELFGASWRDCFEPWTITRDSLPPQGVAVATKIDDANGIRNEQVLILRGSLWFPPGSNVYVYYVPTHWRAL